MHQLSILYTIVFHMTTSWQDNSNNRLSQKIIEFPWLNDHKSKSIHETYFKNNYTHSSEIEHIFSEWKNDEESIDCIVVA